MCSIRPLGDKWDLRVSDRLAGIASIDGETALKHRDRGPLAGQEQSITREPELLVGEHNRHWGGQDEFRVEVLNQRQLDRHFPGHVGRVVDRALDIHARVSRKVRRPDTELCEELRSELHFHTAKIYEGRVEF